MQENELKNEGARDYFAPTVAEQMCQKMDLIIHLLMDVRKNTRQATGVIKTNGGKDIR